MKKEIYIVLTLFILSIAGSLFFFQQRAVAPIGESAINPTALTSTGDPVEHISTYFEDVCRMPPKTRSPDARKSWENKGNRSITWQKFWGYILSPVDARYYFSTMGVSLPLVNKMFGELFLVSDFDENSEEWSPGFANSGRAIVIWWSNSYHEGWQADTFLEYATYDLETAAETRTLATKTDYNAIRNGRAMHVIGVDGVKWMVKYEFEPTFDAVTKIRKTFIFPFPDYYIAVSYLLSEDYPTWDDSIIDTLYHGGYPKKERGFLQEMDRLVAWLKFTKKNR